MRVESKSHGVVWHFNLRNEERQLVAIIDESKSHGVVWHFNLRNEELQLVAIIDQL